MELFISYLIIVLAFTIKAWMDVFEEKQKNKKSEKSKNENTSSNEDYVFDFGDDNTVINTTTDEEISVKNIKREEISVKNIKREEIFDQFNNKYINDFKEMKLYLTNILKGDVGRSRINYAVSILEQKLQNNLEAIYSGKTNFQKKNELIKDNEEILENLHSLIEEYNSKILEIMKEKEEEKIEDSFSEIKKYLDLSLLAKES
jgi:hypothetical protein